MAVMLVVAGLGSCLEGGARRPLGSRCDGDGDCAEGLVCRYGRCRALCSLDRDCPEGGACVPVAGSPGERVCTLEGEGGDEGCPGDLRAVDGLCRETCGPEGEVCEGPRSCVGDRCVEHDTAWIHLVEGASDSYSELTAVAVDRDGFLWVAGEGSPAPRTDGVAVPGEGSLLVARFDPGGGLHWARRFGGGRVTALALSEDGSRAFVGAVASEAVDFGLGPLEPRGGEDMVVASLTSEGEPLWAHRYGDAADQWVTALTVGADGDLFVGAVVEGGVDVGCEAHASIRGVIEVLVARLEGETGACVWSERFGGATDRQRVRDVAIDPFHQELAIVGEYQTQNPDLPFRLGTLALSRTGEIKGYAARLSLDGVPLQATDLWSGGRVRATRVVVGADGSRYVLGVFHGSLRVDEGSLVISSTPD